MPSIIPSSCCDACLSREPFVVVTPQRPGGSQRFPPADSARSSARQTQSAKRAHPALTLLLRLGVIGFPCNMQSRHQKPRLCSALLLPRSGEASPRGFCLTPRATLPCSSYTSQQLKLPTVYPPLSVPADSPPAGRRYDLLGRRPSQFTCTLKQFRASGHPSAYLGLGVWTTLPQSHPSHIFRLTPPGQSTYTSTSRVVDYRVVLFLPHLSLSASAKAQQVEDLLVF